MNKVNQEISSTNNILTVPFGSSAYSVIKDENTNSFFVGISPVVLFSGVNDLSGHLSFNFTDEADTIDGLIVNRKYDELNKVLFTHNVNYLFVTKNIPSELIDSYVFNRNIVDKQDRKFIDSVTSKKLFSSSENNYELYATKNTNVLLKTNNLYFKKINKVKYRLYIKNLSKTQTLSFFDSYHNGWNLYLNKSKTQFDCNKFNYFPKLKTNECLEDQKILEREDIAYSWRKPIFEYSHALENNFSNKWAIDPNNIKDNFDSNYYSVNKDGSINIELVLYFKPQNYFYFGSILSIAIFIIFAAYLLIRKKI